MDKTEDIIHFNRRNIAIWTFYDSKDTRKIQLTHRFYEGCAINVVMQLNDNLLRQGEFLFLNQYTHLPKQRSILVFVFKSVPQKTSYLMNLILKLERSMRRILTNGTGYVKLSTKNVMSF